VTAPNGAFVITAGAWPSIPTSWSLLIDSAPETSACKEPLDFSNVIVAGSTPATSVLYPGQCSFSYLNESWSLVR